MTVQTNNQTLIATTKIILLTSGSSWTVPNDWNSACNYIETFGAGGGGGSGGSAGHQSGGGGGGGYARKNNLTLTPNTSISYFIGSGGTGGSNTASNGAGSNGSNTYFNGSNTTSASVSASGGTGGKSGEPADTAAGGTGVNGDILNTGGTGGSCAITAASGAGGGACAGPNGNGGNGGIGGNSNGGAGGGGADGGGAGVDSSSTAGSNGGNSGTDGTLGGTGGASGAAGNPGSDGSGGGGGGQGLFNGGAGGNGIGRTDNSGGPNNGVTAGPGGGGGGGGGNVAGGNGGAGGEYGGGGGGGAWGSTAPDYGSGGQGGDGLIAITYTVFSTANTTNQINIPKKVITDIGYFGDCNSAGTVTHTGPQNSDSSVTFWTAFTCFGSGPQTSTEAGFYGHSGSAGGTNIRIAIYNSGGTSLIAQSNDFLLNQNSNNDYWSNTSISANLTGGTSYIVALTVSANGIITGNTDGTTSTANWVAADYTQATASPGTFPSSLPSPGGAWYMYPVRVKVQTTTTDNQIQFKKYVDLLSGLIGWWKMNENGGTTLTDSSGQGITGALNGSYTWASGYWQDQGAGYAAMGSPTALANVKHTGTLAVWINFTGAGWQYVMGNMNWTTDLNGYTLGIDNNAPAGRFTFGVANGSTINSVLSTSNMDDGNWHHVVATWDGTNLKIYIDGTLNNTSAQTIDADPASNAFNIGRNAVGNDSYLNAKLKFARVYNRALSTAEVAALYALGT